MKRADGTLNKGQRQAEVMALMDAAGPAGMRVADLAQRIGRSQHYTGNMLSAYGKRGLCVRVGPPRSAVWASAKHVPVPPEVRQRMADRMRRASTRVNQHCASPASAPSVPHTPPAQAPVVEVRNGVRVVVCPSGQDTRFTADPGHVGAFTKQWQAARRWGGAVAGCSAA